MSAAREGNYMAGEMNFLAVDLGASNGRCMLGTLGPDERLRVNELRRFPNHLKERDGALRWDFEALLAHVLKAIKDCVSGGTRLASIGVDTWGVDYVLLDARGALVEAPIAYRDHRTDGVMERFFREVMGPEEIYAITGIQFMPINTLYQLAADRFAGAERLKRARRLLLMPDAFAHALSGCETAEYTIASTTQMLEARTRKWSVRIIKALGLPDGLLPEVVEPGRVVGKINLRGLRRVKVVLPAGHDTAAAIAAVPAASRTHWAYVSAGTWLLAGVEAKEPALSEEARAIGLTNEGGVCGTFRLLKNITGLWLLQECIRHWEAAGERIDLLTLCQAAEGAPIGGPLIDPDDAAFLSPKDMLSEIAAFCDRTGQAFGKGLSSLPNHRGALARCIFESLALKTRHVLEGISKVTGIGPEVVHVVGGGSRNAVLCRMLAGACGLPVLAGPSEATAVGNLLLQALALGRVNTLADCRQIVSESFAPARYEPADAGYWNARYERFLGLLNHRGA